jgi:hypothetical protein
MSRDSFEVRPEAPGHTWPIRLSPVICLLALALASCGGSEAEIPGGADPDQVGVIDEWATTLDRGDVEAAARFFAIPSVAENGPALIRIRDVEDARSFNASLPCGAELTRAESQGDFVVATFLLGERPGPGTCGTGTGTTAQAAFVIEDGEIVEWRRVAAGGEQAPSRSS